MTLNGNATPQAAQAILRNLTFRTTAISTAIRTVQVSVNDGDGAKSNLTIKTVRTIGSNVAPTIGNLGTSIGYDVTFVPRTLDVATLATVTDPDSNFHRGTLTITTPNGQAEDYMRVTSTSNVIESITGGQGQTPLVVTFNDSVNSTASVVQAVLRTLTWGTNSPVEGPRTIIVTLTDGDGGASSSLSKVISVTRTRIAPVLIDLPTETNYYIADQVVRIMGPLNFSTGRLANFANGNLTVSPIEGTTQQMNLRLSTRACLLA